MPDVNDPQHLQLALWAVLAVLAGVLALLGWALRNSLRDVKDGIAAIAADVRQLASRVGGHESSLAAGNVKFQSLERRVDGLEARERQRCNECHYGGG